jgi:DNA-binding transcriptional ArsR family regulator
MVTVAEGFVKAEEFVASDIPTLKAMAEPLRMRLVMLLDDGDLTVKEMAARLGVPPTRLYYHVRILEKFGLIRVTSTRMVSGIEERRYGTTALTWTVSDTMLGNPAISDVLKAMFDMARAELLLALGVSGPPVGDPGGAVPMLMSTRAYLTPDEVREFTHALGELIQGYVSREKRSDATEYHATFAVYRANVRPDDAS